MPAANQKFMVGAEYDLGGGNLGVWNGKAFVSADEYVAQKRRGLMDNLNSPEKQALADAQAASGNAITVLQDLTSFQNVNEGRGRERQSTGKFLGLPVNNFAAAFGDPEAQYLESITSTLAPAKRVPGSGTTSDRDLALFLKGTPGLDKDEATNRSLIEDARREAVRRQARADFFEQYARQNGTLNGAEQAFRAREGKGSAQSPFSPQEAGDRSRLPRGAYYYDPQGNLRRNDNGPAGNPIMSEQDRKRLGAPPPIAPPPRPKSGAAAMSDDQIKKALGF
jgi:hypothetical protein